MTYNMHGMNQGRVLLTEVCAKGSIDIILLQEHWLASKALQQFDAISDNHSHVAMSSMDSSLCNALLTGRPYGGLAIMYKKQLAKKVNIISTGDRMIAVTLGTLLLINVYFPYTSRTDYKDVCIDILSDIASIISSCDAKCILIGGD